MQHVYLEEEMLAHLEAWASAGEFPQGVMSTFGASLSQAHCKSPTPQDTLCLMKETSWQMKTSHHRAVFCHPLRNLA